MTFRTRLFFTSLSVAAVTLFAATVLVSWSMRQAFDELIQRSLVNEARLAAETLSHRSPAAPAELDDEADSLRTLLSARITFVAADGSVLGDSELDGDGLLNVENHGGRPEILEARRSGIGVARRYSTTVGANLLYVAVPVRNPNFPALAFVRLSLPLTEVRDRLAELRRIAAVAIAVGFVAALGLSWAVSTLLSRRVRAIAAVAEAYASGDLSRPARDYGNDEVGTVARVLDESVREIGRRAGELAADRSRMQAILSGMIEGVLVVNEQGRVQLVNDTARRMLRVPPDAAGRHYLEIVRHPEISRHVGAALQGRPAEALELTLPGEPDLIVIARSAPVTAAEAGGAVLVMHDITELRRADRVRRDFVANVSHELRTPLTAVRGYVEALLDGGTEAAEAQRFLEIVSRHTARMERLVRDLLRLARLDARQEQLDLAPCDTESVFAGVQSELSPTLESRRLAVEQRIAAAAATVRGDPTKLHDALRNLIENAANYSPDNGRIVLGADTLDGRIVLTVADEGEGIPEADLPRIFERFYRVDKARSRGGRDPGGTGLGLAIVKHLIELHGGRVRACNRPEGGALFTIELPQ